MTDGEHSQSESVVSENDTNDKRFPYRGILSDHNLDKLKEQFGDVMIIPGKQMRLSGFDENGLVRIPGCAMGYHDSRKILKLWKERAEQDAEEFDWWNELLRRKKIQAIYIRDMLSGVQVSQWKEYQRIFRNAMSNKRTKKSRQIKQRQVLEQTARERKEKTTQAANALIGLTNAT